MKKTSFEVTGLKELQDQLLKFDEKVIKKAVRTAAKKAMVPVRDRAIANVGSDSGDLRDSIKLRAGSSAGKSKGRVGWAYVSAGGKLKKGLEGTPTGSYVLSEHYGTQYIDANPFLESAFTPHIPSILQSFKAELTKETARGLKIMSKRKGSMK
jgi:HK97 gp10 family phage protein